MRPTRRLIAIALLALAACAAPPPAAELPPLVWPEAPEPPRVAWLQAFSSAEDLGIRPGLVRRLADLVFGAEDLRLVRPMAVLVEGERLYVADPGQRGVHRFDRAAGRHRLLRAAGGLPLPSPVGLAAGPDGRVFVSDSALAKVFVIGRDAEEAVELPLTGPLLQPTGLAFDPAARRLLVVDTRAHLIRVFDLEGRAHATLGERGEEDGRFNFPTLLWRDRGGRLFVTDSLNFRVQVLGADGRFLSKFGRHGDRSGDLARHKGVATDRFGHVYVVDALQHALQVFDDQGRLLLGIGAQGRERGEFWLPTGIHIDDEDRIYVADAYNRRVQVFRYVGGTP